ncbi:uncharacterized protein LOC116193756 [Punica granatum]|uniref:Uncharacterized protein n=2 Tax=Punica granatum TaxID=22663 RepID=A0A218VTG7_PUNGR|nr:uncharacterized protein LOC116193756 [Punica granatum]OWM63579.1 hypothetical protein CDL15_Pgr008122 [Punica granatum]PKI37814.1 hypothetical protein CRG98_041764 [Punica granatum]
MDNLYGNSPRFGKVIALPGNMPMSTAVYSHPSTERGRHKSFAKTPTCDPYSSRYGNLMKLLQSKSPSSVLDNIGPMTPLKLNMEEDTLVMDGIPVESSSGGSSSGNSHSRRPVYRAVEDNICSFPVTKPRLIRGKEEQQHPSRLSVKNNSPEAVLRAAAELEAPKTVAAPPSRPAQTHKSPNIKVPTRDWSPLDDGIVVDSPSRSQEDIHPYIHRFMHEPRSIRRLPVFTEITRQ